jgi:hypothetical protein
VDPFNHFEQLIIPSRRKPMKMKATRAIATAILASSILIAAACGGGAASSSNDKVIRSAPAGKLTVALASSTGELKKGDNELILVFTDSSGKPVDVGAASLKFRMPAMGSMAEMNDAATLTATATPGRYQAKVNIEVAGTWEAIVNYQGPQGSGQASISVSAS